MSSTAHLRQPNGRSHLPLGKSFEEKDSGKGKFFKNKKPLLLLGSFWISTWVLAFLVGRQHSCTLQSLPIPIAPNEFKKETPAPSGLVVLGMHRSGTSMLTGLLHKTFGYELGGPLFKGKANQKGFFENGNVVEQNDEYLCSQNMSYWYNTHQTFDGERALRDYLTGRLDTEYGRRSLSFFRNVTESNRTWIQKDPRMCLTLPTWIPLLNLVGVPTPAIVFVYRHPLASARSFHRVDATISITSGLQLWMTYNQRALLHSQGLCRVVTSNAALLDDPRTEVQRIADQLKSQCGLVPPQSKNQVNPDIIKDFVDKTLQTSQHVMDSSVTKNGPKLTPPPGCTPEDYSSHDSVHAAKDPALYKVYRQAMEIYCDLCAGRALRADYPWPAPPVIQEFQKWDNDCRSR